MANIKKSYNFSNGFQIDDDNVVVNANGLVGFGTTIPTEVVDVYGNIKISASSQIPGAIGLLTCASIYTKRIEVEQNTILKSGSIGLASFTSAGVVTASNSALGGLQFFGDGAGLINIPTSQWVDVAPGIAQSSYYAAGNVGIATNYPAFPFQVGGNNVVSGFSGGLGVNRVGDVITPTGIITAARFSGNGSTLTNLNASALSSGTVPADTLPIIPNSKLSSDINLTGIITASKFSGEFIGTVTGNVVGLASTALSLTADAAIDVLQITVGFATCGVATISKLDVTRGGTSSNNATIGINTLTHRSDLHISKNSGISSALLTSAPNSYSLFTLGRNAGSQSGGMRFGFVGSASRKYSNANTLDIINNDTGSLNFYASNTDAKMFWLWDNQTEPAMTLISNGTEGGSLIIGAAGTTLLSGERLRVSGIMTVTSNAFVGGNLNVTGSINAGSINFSLDNKNINTTDATGISTFNNFNIRNKLSLATAPGVTEFVGLSSADFVIGDWSTAPRTNCVVMTDEGIGIGTTAMRNVVTGGIGTVSRIDGYQASALFRTLSIGSTSSSAVVDFGNAGAGIGGGYNQYRFMIVPKVNSTAFNSLSSASSGTGGIVFNTSDNQFYGLVGTGWTAFASASAGSNASTVTVTGENPTSGGAQTRYLMFGATDPGNGSTTSGQTVRVDTDLTYDPRNNLLTVPNLTVSNTLNATVSSTTNATNATNINISATSSSDTSTSVVLVASQTTGNQAPFIDSSLAYNASTGTLTASNFSGNGSGLTGIAPSYTRTNASNDYTIANGVQFLNYTATQGGPNSGNTITLSTTLNLSIGQQIIIHVNNGSDNGAIPAQLITSGVTLYYAGSTGSVNLSLAKNAVVTLLCIASNTYVAYGNGITAITAV